MFYSGDSALNHCTSPTLWMRVTISRGGWKLAEVTWIIFRSWVKDYAGGRGHAPSGGRTQSLAHGRNVGWAYWMNVQIYHFLVNRQVSKVHMMIRIFLLHYRHCWWQSGYEWIKFSQSMAWAIDSFFCILLEKWVDLWAIHFNATFGSCLYLPFSFDYVIFFVVAHDAFFLFCLFLR